MDKHLSKKVTSIQKLSIDVMDFCSKWPLEVYTLLGGDGNTLGVDFTTSFAHSVEIVRGSSLEKVRSCRTGEQASIGPSKLSTSAQEWPIGERSDERDASSRTSIAAEENIHGPTINSKSFDLAHRGILGCRSRKSHFQTTICWSVIEKTRFSSVGHCPRSWPKHARRVSGVVGSSECWFQGRGS